MLTKEQIKQSQALEAVILAANKEINNSQNFTCQKYIKKRGLDDKLINHFKLGFIPRKFYNDALSTFSCKAIKSAHPEWTNEEIVSLAGKNNLIKAITTQKGDAFIDTYSNRLLYPFKDKNNYWVGLTGRDIPQPKSTTSQPLAKYLNTPENDIFHKREIFFNYQYVKEHYNSTKPLIICEGVMDVCAFQKSNVLAVAGSGIALSQEQIDMIKNLKAKEVILSYDNDIAGKDAMARNYSLLQQNGIDVKFIDYSGLEQKDMDDIVNSPAHGPKTVNNLVNKAQEELPFLLKYFSAKRTIEETKVAGTQTKKITFKPVEKLPDIEKFQILYDVFQSFANNHNFAKNNYLLPKKEYFKLKKFLAQTLKISEPAAKQLILYFSNIEKQKPKRKIRFIKGAKKDRPEIQWEQFENEDTMHFIMDAIGAKQSHKRNFYHSPWNSDDDASFSIKRGTGMWSDFSAGRSGGPFQLLAYCDLSDPAHPVVTENQNQSTYAQAYNWLIKSLKSDLKPTEQADMINSYAFDPAQKAKIEAIKKAFDNELLVSADKDVSDQQQSKQLLLKYYPEYFNKPLNKDNFPPFMIPIKHSGCSYPIYDIALMSMNKINDNKIVSVHPDSKYFPYFESYKNSKALDLCFSMSAPDFLNSNKNNYENNVFMIPDTIKSLQLKEILNNDYKIIDIKKPSLSFLKTNFNILSKCQKPVFVDGQDLYTYIADKNIIAGTDIIKSLATDNPTSIFADQIINQIAKVNKKHPNYYKTIFKNALKANDFPPVH